MENTNTGPDATSGVLRFFVLLKTFEADIRESAREGGGLIVNITPLGGRFGLHPATRHFSEEAAGALGVAKSAAMEWPGVRTRCIDVDPAMEAERMAAMAWEEIWNGSDFPEIGIDRQARRRITLSQTSCFSGKPKIDSASVILLLGGGSGITGAIAQAMAKRHHPRLILTGRTALSEKEPPETAVMGDKGTLRSFFIRTAGEKNAPATPAEIDRRIDGILKKRRLVENIENIKASGADVEYHQLDVRDPASVARLVEEIYRRYGRIDGVVHGAGIIEDRRIRDKSPDSFMAVYSTKIIPARVLAQKLNPSTLKFLVFFSSVAGRFGNAGQSDYSAANEVLNKLAAHLAAKWTRTRVVSIGWGPWEMGMVNDRLKRKYREQGIDLIGRDAGIDFFFNEIETDPDDLPEIVATAAPWKNAVNGRDY
jgi:NAD(P)-dependent dehydrogenase (short-subunit alcohol dehydrogenase family)